MTITTVEYRAAARTHAAAWPARLSLLSLCAVAILLRFWAFGRLPSDPFYDAAVRSMGLSWHNFFVAAFDPRATVSIDKPPLDLWLQVLATKAFGYSSASVRLPEAIAGVLAIPLLYDLVRRGAGRVAGLSAAAALAVLPAAVMTSRSDVMDTLTGTVLTAAAWAMIAAPPERRRAGVLLAAALAGLAFEIKLFQAAVAFPALFVIAWLRLADVADRRRTLLQACALLLAVAAAWPVAASLAPGAHPWPLGSTNGQLWNVILVYNGLYRLGAATGTTAPVGPSPWRLFTPGYMSWVGYHLLVTAGFCATALLARRWLTAERVPLPANRALVTGVTVWIVSGYLLFSVQGWIRIRYLEAFTPAVAAGFGLSVAGLWQAIGRRRRWRPPAATAMIAVSLLVLLAWPLKTSADIARTGRYDSQTLGALPAAWVERLHGYLQTHVGGSRLAVSSAVLAGPLIVRDPQPVVLLTSWKGRPFTSTAQLRGDVARGSVRYALVDPVLQAPSVRWALATGTDVTSLAGLGSGTGPNLRLLRFAP